MVQPPHAILLINPHSSAHAGRLCAMTIWSTILNIFNVDIIHHLVVRNRLTYA